jgi:RecB family endonuclease NucS
MSSIDRHPEKNIIRVQLRQNLVLKGVGEADLAALEQQLSIVDRQKGEFLLHQGVKEMEQYFVLDGILKRVVTNPKGETLTITFHEVLDQVEHHLGDDPGLTKDGVEAHLQELLAGAPDAIEMGLELIRREYPTAIGPVDLACRDAQGRFVAVEVKRRGDIDGVEQLARYLERLRLDSSLGEVRGIFVAQQIKPQARVMAESRGLHWVEVDYDELRGLQPDELRLF